MNEPVPPMYRRLFEEVTGSAKYCIAKEAMLFPFVSEVCSQKNLVRFVLPLFF
jgi:hypothetical protein